MSENYGIGVIGGSGLYSMEGAQILEERMIETPFGEPSSPLFLAEVEGRRVAFLARHGLDHTLSPTEVNYRANMYALRKAGVERVISISACGSLREDYAPGELVVPDQLYDNTKSRKMTFFEDGLVAHVDVAEPFCTDLSGRLSDSAEACDATVYRSGSYVTIEGPRFSTRAESNTYRAWGMSIVGMTTSPEAFLAREAEMCYSVLAHVTDYDVWRTAEDPVTVEMVFKVLQQNTELAQQTLRHLIPTLPSGRTCSCHRALKSALTTDPESIHPNTREKLSLFVDPYLD
ncbi:MAG: S-methyl-5'-thioadenosine phosphorylase [Anaerolineales bacterium]